MNILYLHIQDVECVKCNIFSMLKIKFMGVWFLFILKRLPIILLFTIWENL